MYCPVVEGTCKENCLCWIVQFVVFVKSHVLMLNTKQTGVKMSVILCVCGIHIDLEGFLYIVS